MRLLGAPAIPAPGLHPFWGSAPLAFRRRCRSRHRTAPIALFRASPHMEAAAAFAAGWKPPPASRLMGNVRRQGMSDDIRYNKRFDLVPGCATAVAPGVR